ncbi:MAG: hypothetical protein IKX40_03275 [Thermoguttaceae bacterium]|nr:hypothetical protein [Thermoguttaceae bacterium]
MVEYRNFFARFSGYGGRMTLNEKDECWEYVCPGKGKIVVWLDPNDEEQCVFLNVRFLDVDGNPMPKNNSRAIISCATVIDPMGAILLEFAPTRTGLIRVLPYHAWAKLIRPDQIVGLPGLITFATNSFDVDYLLIPERPEFFPREEREMTPEREANLRKMKAFKDELIEMEKQIEQQTRENIQRAKEEWDEWERRQADENDDNRGE